MVPGSQMDACLLILKLALARSAEEDGQAREEKTAAMKVHLEACLNCAAFVAKVTTETEEV